MREQLASYYRLVSQTIGNLEVSSAEGHRAFASRVRGAVGPFNRPGVRDVDLADPEVRARLFRLVPRTEEARAELRFIQSRVDNLGHNIGRIADETSAMISALESYHR